MRTLVAASAISSVLIGLALADPAAASIKVSTHIGPQDLGSALRTLAADRHLQILYTTQTVEHQRTGGAVGEFTADEALTRLLGGTGLVFRYIDENTIAVVSRAEAEHADGRIGSAPLSDLKQQTQQPDWTRVHFAQADSAGAPGADRREPAGPPALQEIVVTAQKREERLLDVPLSIAAISAEDIDRRGMVNAADYLRGIPGVNQVDDSTGGSIIIRGLETSPYGQNFSSGPTVATYFGETPTTNSGGLANNTNVDLKLVDIERVEVLRGPQGTAFGNSSLGGAVRTIPVAPKLNQFEGKVATNYSSTSGTGGDNYMAQAVLNIPLINDMLAIRATGYQFHDSGYYRNRAGSDPAFQALAASYGAQAFAVDQNEVGGTTSTGGRVALLFKPTDEFKLRLNYVRQKTDVDGTAVATTGTYDQAIYTETPEFRRHGRDEAVSDTDIEIYNAIGEYNFGWATLLGTYSHIQSEAYVSGLLDTPVDDPASALNASDHHENSGEIRLVSQLDGPWNFIAGLYGENLHDVADFPVIWPVDVPTNIFGDRFIGDYHDQRKLTQKAAFGEVSWKFLPRWTLTGGARRYHYNRTVDVQTSGAFSDSSTLNSAGTSGTNYRGNLSFKLNENANFYANYSEGFRLGKPQPGLAPGLCDVNGDGLVDGTTNVSIASTKVLESDTVKNYELGMKLALLNRRVELTADVFHMDWDNVPIRIRAPARPNGCGLAYNANAGAAKSEGVEFQANVQATDAVRLDLGASAIHAVLKNDAPLLDASAGARLPGSPKINANAGLQYSFNLGNRTTVVRTDAIYVGEFYGDLAESPLTRAGNYVKLDASARMQLQGYNVDLFVRNLTNSDAFTFRGITPVTAYWGYRQRPRTVGLQISCDF